jgi:hypothetical protein
VKLLIETAGYRCQGTRKPRREAGGRFGRHLAGALHIARSPLAVVFGAAHLRCRTSDVDRSLFVVVIDLEVVHLYMHFHASRLDYSPFAVAIDRQVVHLYMRFHASRLDYNQFAATADLEGSRQDTRSPRLDRRPLVVVFVLKGVELRIPHASRSDRIRGYSS